MIRKNCASQIIPAIWYIVNLEIIALDKYVAFAVFQALLAFTQLHCKK